MKVELINCTPDAIHLMARSARATRKRQIEPDEDFAGTMSVILDMVEKDEKFVKSLIKVKHYGVLEHCNFTFHVSEISRCLTHQLVRHRIGFSYLQMSSRHAKPNELDYVIPNTIKGNTKLMIYPDDEYEDVTEEIQESYRILLHDAYEVYTNMINEGVPIEDARYVLPPAFFTHISFTCNARSLIHMLELRLARGAQWEIKELAVKLFDAVYEIYPVIFEHLKELRDIAACDINYKESK